MEDLDLLYGSIPKEVIDKLTEIDSLVSGMTFKKNEISKLYRESTSSTKLVKYRHLKALCDLTSREESVELVKYVFTRCSNLIYYSKTANRAVPVEDISEIDDLEIVDDTSNIKTFNKLKKSINNRLGLDVDFPEGENMQVLGIIVRISGVETFIHFKNIIKFLNDLGVDSLTNTIGAITLSVRVVRGIVVYVNRQLAFNTPNVRDFVYEIEKDEDGNWLMEDSLLKLKPSVNILRNNKGTLSTYTKSLTGVIRVPKLVVRDKYSNYFSRR